MPAMTVRNLPANVAEGLRRRARAEGRSVNALVCELLARAVAEDERRQRMAAQRPRAEQLRRALRTRYGEGAASEKLLRRDRRR